MSKLERYRAMRDKKKARLEKAKQEMDKLDQLVLEEENTQIIAAVRSYSLTPEELADFLREHRKGGAPVFVSHDHEEAYVHEWEESNNDENL